MKVVEQFKRRILDLAIRGKLVPQDPNDEPASILLERIKAEKAKLVKAGKIKKEKSPSEIVIGSDGAAYEKRQSAPQVRVQVRRLGLVARVFREWQGQESSYRGVSLHSQTRQPPRPASQQEKIVLRLSNGTSTPRLRVR